MQQRINFCLLEQTHATPKNTSPTTMTSSGDTQKSQILKLCTGREKIMMETELFWTEEQWSWCKLMKLLPSPNAIGSWRLRQADCRVALGSGKYRALQTPQLVFSRPWAVRITEIDLSKIPPYFTSALKRYRASWLLGGPRDKEGQVLVRPLGVIVSAPHCSPLVNRQTPTLSIPHCQNTDC